MNAKCQQSKVQLTAVARPAPEVSVVMGMHTAAHTLYVSWMCVQLTSLTNGQKPIVPGGSQKRSPGDRHAQSLLVTQHWSVHSRILARFTIDEQQSIRCLICHEWQIDPDGLVSHGRYSSCVQESRLQPYIQLSGDDKVSTYTSMMTRKAAC